MSPFASLILDFAAATDIGCKRGNNEDSFGYDAGLNIYVVCDGMGGRAAGEIASAMAVRTLIETFEAQTAAASTGVAASVADLAVESRLLESIREANRAVREASLSDLRLSGMGTTLVCACIEGDRVLVGNVGDSRAYLIRNGTPLQITLDHSLLEEQVRQGLLSPEMAATSTLQSVITRAVGAADIVEPDFFAAELLPRDLLLLASDGLTRYVEAQEIASIAESVQELSAACHALVDAAKRRGGADNITCMLLRAIETPGEDATDRAPAH